MYIPFKKYLTDTSLYRGYKQLRAKLATQRYGAPTRDMVVMGVTGTDGKTTTCNLIHRILQQTVGDTVYMGTTGVKIGDEELSGVQKMTSYDPTDLQRILAQARKAGCKHAVLEVSSHGLEQLRFQGVDFSAGVLTNIANEHLDYHGTYERYQAAKKKLFTYVANGSTTEKLLVLPAHQEDITDRAEEFRGTDQVWYGLEPDNQLRADNIEMHTTGCRFTAVWGDERVEVSLPLVGKFNIRNALAAMAAVRVAGVSLDEAAKSLTTFPGISGRQEHYHEAGVDRFIDFAHTPYALQGMLSYLREVTTKGRLRCLFGAPGMRDPYKRPEMGRVVDELADMMIITDDDADKEDRYQIIDHIKEGVAREEGESYQVIPDRREAIQYLVDHVTPGDVVLLAGKGHEQVLVTNEGKIPRSDKGVLFEALQDSGLIDTDDA